MQPEAKHTSLILIRILFGAIVLYDSVSTVRYFNTLTERFGFDGAIRFFPAYVAAGQAIALVILLFFLGNSRIRQWFDNYGLKES